MVVTIFFFLIMIRIKSCVGLIGSQWLTPNSLFSYCYNLRRSEIRNCIRPSSEKHPVLGQSIGIVNAVLPKYFRKQKVTVFPRDSLKRQVVIFPKVMLLFVSYSFMLDTTATCRRFCFTSISYNNPNNPGIKQSNLFMATR